MNSTNRMRLASRLCTLGAWATVALGIALGILFYALNNVNNGPDSGPNVGIVIFVELIIAMLSLFFFLVLYAIGALLNYMSASKKTLEEGTIPARMRDLTEEDDTQLEITPLQPRG